MYFFICCISKYMNIAVYIVLVCLTGIYIVMSLQSAKSDRKVCKTKLTKLGNKISTILVEGDRLAEIPVLITEFKVAFDDFSKSHDEVTSLDEANILDHEVYYDHVESNFLKILATAKDVKQAAASFSSPVPSSPSSDVIGLLSLPKLELEVFSGEPIKYHTFIKAFKASVEKCSDDPDVRLSRLFQYLSGEPRDSIRSSMFVGGSNGYESALQTLEKLYGSPHRVTQDIIRSLRSSKPVKSCRDVRNLSHELRNAYLILESIKNLLNFWNF